MRLLLALAWLLVPVAVSAASPAAPDPSRLFADSMAAALAAGKDSLLQQNLSPSMLAAYGEERMMEPLAQIRERHGQILSYELRRVSVGRQMAGSRILRTSTYWYALRTSTQQQGPFLQIVVAQEDGRHRLAGYRVVEFAGGVPPELRVAPVPGLEA